MMGIITSGRPGKLDTTGNSLLPAPVRWYPRRMWNATKSILTGLLGTRSVESPSVFKSVTLILNIPTSYISVERGFGNVLSGILYRLQMFPAAIEPALAETAPRQS